MPRMSEAEKQRSHSRILDAAARLFRENGIETTSVSDVMTAAGMTHGGFYRHFASKEELIQAAFTHAVGGVVSSMESEDTRDEQDQSRRDYIATYLSQEHVQNRGLGCPLAAMGAELTRIGGSPKQAGAQATTRMAALLEDRSTSHADQGLAAMALLLGTITLARLVGSEDEAERTLDAGRTGIRLLQDLWPPNRSSLDG